VLRPEDSCVSKPNPLREALREDEVRELWGKGVTRTVSLVVDQELLAPGNALDLAMAR
jgi:hypothetical protein